jgi:predicted metal-binding membrane protein
MAWPRIHDQRLILTLLGSLVLLAWWALWIGEQSPWGHYALHGNHALKMGVSPALLAAAFVGGWTVMTIAMMLPTSTPLVLLFARMVGDRGNAGRLIGLLVAGYLAVWIAFGAGVFLAIRLLQDLTSGVAWLAANGWAASAAILLGAGVYQFTPWKYACLDKCRSPMSFLISGWSGKNPARDAFRLGAEHGAFCVGCCWSLMLVMFAMGTGGLAWMLGLGAVMAAEKNPPWGRKLSAPVGVALIAGAVGIAILGRG